MTGSKIVVAKLSAATTANSKRSKSIFVWFEIEQESTNRAAHSLKVSQRSNPNCSYRSESGPA